MRLPAAPGPSSCAALRLLLLTLLLLLAAVDTVAPHGSDLHSPARLRTALSPEGLGLRPGGGPGTLGGQAHAGGAVPALQERPDRLYDPQPGDLNATLLRAKLGRHFDPRVMSVQRPSAAKRQHSQHKVRYNDLLDADADSRLLDDDQVELDEDSPFRRNMRGRLVPAGEMPESIANLDLRGVRLPDGSRLRTRISPRLRRKLQHFLWAYTACPVQRRWRDLGVRFWPRWLREGHCPPSPCSIPPGMRCKPAATRHQALLRWHCRPLPTLVLQHGLGQHGLGQHGLGQHGLGQHGLGQHGLGQHGQRGLGDERQEQQAPGHALEQTATRHCTWIKVEYPIITECSCGCAEDRYS
ncbi:noggin-like [Frankliniella occidentalis]|uniref:Noggin-like n=1 Tax=Frankliniella occidentalis TaxID=133901 RepID=A0A9C6U5C1_FRAOC|nr:noggin-like [Frankliniella occidentalis]XP_052126534.1 noggin-like [Frankliniella occidentalis]XP_052126535.1 noggin-like [Frankliniella occidentalis]